jgi:hypothetical protein
VRNRLRQRNPRMQVTLELRRGSIHTRRLGEIRVEHDAIVRLAFTQSL